MYHKVNGGLSDARNYGILHANGKYISFVDGDDWIEKEYIEKLLLCVLKYNADFSQCQFQYAFDDRIEKLDVKQEKYKYFLGSRQSFLLLNLVQLELVLLHGENYIKERFFQK